MGNERPDLDGFRGRDITPEEQLEDDMRDLHDLDSEIDVQLVREVLKSDQLVTAMQGDRVVARLVTMVTQRIDDCAKVWSTQQDPTSIAALNAHREARAARLLIDWIEKTINSGSTAETQLHEADRYDQENA